MNEWIILESRKENPEFRRNIADNNMYSQYIRDFLDDNPRFKFKDVKKYWMLKKRQPNINEFVKYEKSDLELLN